MIASPAQVLRQYLIDAGVVNEPGRGPWPAVVGPLPPDGSDYVVVRNTGAVRQGRLTRTGERVVKPKAQVVIRGVDEPTAWTKGSEIEAAFDLVGTQPFYGGAGWVAVTVGDEAFILKVVVVTVPLTPVGEEPDTRRSLFSINVLMEVRPVVRRVFLIGTLGQHLTGVSGGEIIRG